MAGMRIKCSPPPGYDDNTMLQQSIMVETASLEADC